MRLSPSRVSEFTNCPQLYKYRSIDKLPEPPSIDAERGTLVHTVLHDLFESPAELRNLDTAVELITDLREHGIELTLVSASPRSLVDAALSNFAESPVSQ